MNKSGTIDINIDELRNAVMDEYDAVARTPGKGFHFHTGRPHALRLGYREEWLEGVPEASINSFAGTGNPFSMGELAGGERVVDIGCGAGIDSFIAARMVGSEGSVIGIDMTDSMLNKARQGIEETGLRNIVFKKSYGEELTIPKEWADVVISNGVINLMPDKQKGFREIARILKPGGRMQIADILVQRAVPDSAKKKIELWTG